MKTLKTSDYQQKYMLTYYKEHIAETKIRSKLTYYRKTWGIDIDLLREKYGDDIDSIVNECYKQVYAKKMEKHLKKKGELTTI